MILPGLTLGGFDQQAHDSQPQCCLAGAALADEGQAFASMQVERDAANGLDAALTRAIADMNVLQAQRVLDAVVFYVLMPGKVGGLVHRLLATGPLTRWPAGEG